MEVHRSPVVWFVALVTVLATVPVAVLSAPLGPGAGPLATPGPAQFPADTLDATGACTSLEAGSAVRDITPGLRQADGTYELWHEPFEDTNGNGVYDAPNPLDPTAHSDPFTDENLNGKWDGPFMAGYGHDKEGNEYYQAKTVHDPVWARAIALSCGDVQLGMVSLDVVGLLQQHVWDIREAVAEAGFDHVIVASTHTHDSVDTMGLWGPNELTDGKDPRTMDHMKSLAAEALIEASGELEPVTVQAGAQRTQAPGIVEWAGYVQTDLRDPFVIDDLVLALQFLTEDETLATLVNWSPHPETLAGTKSEISSDFADQLRRSVETEGATVGGTTMDALGGDAVYFSGAVGGMMTTLGADVYDEQGRLIEDHSYAKADRIGEAAAFSALKGLSEGQQLAIDGLRVQVREVSFPMDNPFLAALNTIGIFEHPVGVGPAHVEAIDPIVGVVPPVPIIRTEVNVVTLTSQGEDVVQLVTVPGELLPEIAVGGMLDGGAEASPETCFEHNPLKQAVNGGRSAQPNPATGQREAGYERVLAAHADIPPEPVLRDHMTGEYKLVLGLANDELGYIVPANDFIQAVGYWPPDTIYSDGTDRCGDDDHYEETVSAGSIMAPVVANNLAHLLDPAFEPAEYPARLGGVLGDAQDVEAVTSGEESVGVWLDTSGSGGYESQEDAHVQASLPSWVSGAWGFVGPNGGDIGQSPGEDVRGLWVDLNGNERYDAGDGTVFVDHWGFQG